MQVSERIIAIPARLASTRFPEKVLADLHGKPMIQWTYQQAQLARPDRILIVTDSKKIAAVAEGFGAEVFLSTREHDSGSSRIAEMACTLDFSDDSRILNLQADEPLVPVENIHQVFDNLDQYPKAQITTLCEEIHTEEELLRPSCVKVVRDQDGYALYFSRAPIPYAKTPVFNQGHYFRHIGLYCFRAPFLKTLDQSQPTWLERQESLEQLSFMVRGHRIHVDEAREKSLPGVDLPADLDRVNQAIKARAPQADSLKNPF